MKTPNSIELVLEFQQTFHHPIQENPIIPSEGRTKLRIALLEEELEELKIAIKNRDIVEMADSLCDLQYVLAGAILEFGFGEKFESLFYEVHRSNMSKAAPSEEDAEDTISYLKKHSNVEAYYENIGERFLIYRKSDNKILKSITYSPPNLKDILI